MQDAMHFNHPTYVVYSYPNKNVLSSPRDSPVNRVGGHGDIKYFGGSLGPGMMIYPTINKTVFYAAHPNYDME